MGLPEGRDMDGLVVGEELGWEVVGAWENCFSVGALVGTFEGFPISPGFVGVRLLGLAVVGDFVMAGFSVFIGLGLRVGLDLVGCLLG